MSLPDELRALPDELWEDLARAVAWARERGGGHATLRIDVKAAKDPEWEVTAGGRGRRKKCLTAEPSGA